MVSNKAFFVEKLKQYTPPTFIQDCFAEHKNRRSMALYHSSVPCHKHLFWGPHVPSADPNDIMKNPVQFHFLTGKGFPSFPHQQSDFKIKIQQQQLETVENIILHQEQHKLQYADNLNIQPSSNDPYYADQCDLEKLFEEFISIERKKRKQPAFYSL